MTIRNNIILLLTLLSLPIAACGVKPNSLEAPPEVEEDTFPHTYPTE